MNRQQMRRYIQSDDSKKAEREQQRFLAQQAERDKKNVITDPVIIELMFLEHINV